MEAKQFLKEWKRMCNRRDCEGCEAFKYCPRHEYPDFIKHFEKLSDVVEKWSKNHPANTRLNDFLKKYPNAPKREDGVPRVCCAALGYRECCNIATESTRCEDCWNCSMEEGEQDGMDQR